MVKSRRVFGKILPRGKATKTKIFLKSKSEKSILVRGVRGLEGDQTEVWFVIESTGSKGIQAREILQDRSLGKAQSNNERCPILDELPPDAYFLGQACCAQVGSFLYVLGGRDHTPGGLAISDTVRRLNLKNPRGGWEALKPLPFPLGESKSCVNGNLIYVFPRARHGGCDADIPGGFIYNTNEEKVYDIAPPFGYKKFQMWMPEFCFYHDFRDGRKGVILPARSLYLYSQECECWDAVKKSKLLQFKAREIQCAFLNKILYVSYWDWDCDWDYEDNRIRTRVCAYDVETGAHLFGDGIMVPAFKKLDDTPCSFDMFLVAVADFKLCYLWVDNGCETTSVFIATVVFSPETMSAFVYEKEIELDASWIINVLPFISHEYQPPEGIHWDVERMPRTELDMSRSSSFFVGEISVPFTNMNI